VRIIFHRGFTLIEVLVALAILGAGAFALTFAFGNAVIGLHRQQDNSHWVSDLQFVRRQVLLAKDMDALEEGDEIDTLSSGVIAWQATEIEMAEVIDLFRVVLEYEIEDAPEGLQNHTEVLYLLRPNWSSGEFAGDRQDLLQDKRDNMRRSRQEGGLMNW
jgi:prepilin-type N-terminal cleavage/methylation domain-containing protein